MLKKSIFLVVMVIIFSGCVSEIKENKESSVRQILSDSNREEIINTFMLTQTAWNNGNLDEFMKAYWKSDSLVFVGYRGATYGYEPTLESYKRGYPDKIAMGTLEYEINDLRAIDNTTALMIGKFYLTREIGDMQGYYTLVWQKIDGAWVIISDHSSGEAVSGKTVK